MPKAVPETWLDEDQKSKPITLTVVSNNSSDGAKFVVRHPHAPYLVVMKRQKVYNQTESPREIPFYNVPDPYLKLLSLTSTIPISNRAGFFPTFTLFIIF